MCFTLGWLEQLLVWIVVIAVVVGVLQLLIPWVFSLVGVPLGPLPMIVRYIVLGVIAIAVIYFVFGLLECVVGGGGFPHLVR